MTLLKSRIYKNHLITLFSTTAFLGFFCLFSLLSILTFTGCTVNPVTGRQELSLISEKKEVAIGEANYPVTTQINNGVFQDSILQSYIGMVGKNLASVSHRPGLPFEFNVVNSSELNAYALPGGKISITRGLLNRLGSEDQLAGILGHEIGHAAARHSATQMSKQIVAGVAMAGIGAFLADRDVKNRELYTLSSTFATGLLLLKYSREQEMQADLLALEYMVKAGYNPDGYLQTMEIIHGIKKREPSRAGALFRSHPLTSERIRRIEIKLNTSYRELLSRPFKISTFLEKTQYLAELGNAYNHYNKGDTLMGQRDFEGAEREYHKAISLDNSQAVFHMGLAWALLMQGKHKKARISVNVSIKLYPDLFSSRFLGGVILYRLKNYNQAILSLKKADRLIPSVLDVKLYKARCYEGLGDISKAIDNYREVIRLAPDSKGAKEARTKLIRWGVIRP